MQTPFQEAIARTTRELRERRCVTCGRRVGGSVHATYLNGEEEIVRVVPKPPEPCQDCRERIAVSFDLVESETLEHPAEHSFVLAQVRLAAALFEAALKKEAIPAPPQTSGGEE